MISHIVKSSLINLLYFFILLAFILIVVLSELNELLPDLDLSRIVPKSLFKPKLFIKSNIPYTL